MGKKIITYGDIEVEKHQFHHCKNLILLEDVSIKKSAGVKFGFFRRKKLSIFYLLQRWWSYKIKQLHTMLPKISHLFLKMINS